MARKLVTLQAVAQQVGVDDTTVRRWIASGKIEGVRLAGHSIRVYADSLDRIIEPIRPTS